MRRVIGLTGNIASGKSTVSMFMKEMGIKVLDADQISRELVAKGSSVLEEIVQVFGTKILDSNGSLDRKRLGEIVFADTTALNRLNRMIHPRIRERIQKEIETFRHHPSLKLLVIEAPLLFETGLDQLVDCVWFVEADQEQQLKRLMDRNNLTRQEALNRINAQQAPEEKKHRADVVIQNDGTLDQLKNRVNILLEKKEQA